MIVMVQAAAALALSAQQPIGDRAALVVNDVCVPFAGVDGDLQQAKNNADALGLKFEGIVAGNHVLTSPDIEVNLTQSGSTRFCYVNLVRTRSFSPEDLAPLDRLAANRRLKPVPEGNQVRRESSFLILTAGMDEDDDGNPFVGITMISK